MSQNDGMIPREKVEDAEDALDSQVARKRLADLAGGKVKTVSGAELGARLAAMMEESDFDSIMGKALGMPAPLGEAANDKSKRLSAYPKKPKAED